MPNTVRVSFDRGETFNEITLDTSSAVFNDSLFEEILPAGKTIDYATVMYPEEGDDRVEDVSLEQEIEIADGMRFIINLKDAPNEEVEEPIFENPVSEPVNGNEPHSQFDENTFISQRYNREDYLDDEHKFIIPFLAMNDGYTPAQIRSEATGLFRDVQRSPFLRKKGIIEADNTIPDLDITPLVRYGTLQQARIAPTLENIEVRLFIREPNLKKVPSHNEGSAYADKYIWREIPAGFHVYNNDTVYGYEWIVLQDDYSGTDGIYNLHMNIEDGLGVCKFAGTQAPISLKGVEYKLIVVAKSLFNREYSLLDDQPLARSLSAYSDVMAPTVTAVKKFYEKLVETEMVKALALNAGNGQLEVDEEGVVADTLSVTNFAIKDKTIVFEEDLDEHKEDLVENPAVDDNGKALGVHGIKNTGFTGNIRAHSLDGAVLSNGAEAITEDVPVGSYIPFVDENNSIGLGTTTNYFAKNNNVPKKLAESSLTTISSTLLNRYKVTDDDINKLINQFVVGTSIFNSIISKDEDGVLNFELKEGNLYGGNVNFKSYSGEFTEVKIGSFDLNYEVLQSLLNSSSITKKIVISEKLPVNVKDGLGTTILVPNLNAKDGQGRDISVDADGNIVEPLDTTSTIEGYELKVEDFEATPDEEGLKALTKLGSALQALQELPLSTWEYKRGQEEYKQQLGIIVERVNQVRDKLRTLKGTDNEVDGAPADTNYLVHKRNTLIKSAHSKVLDKDEGINASDELVNNNTYTYTDEEVKSIVNYLNLFTSKKELQQEIRNTVGVLLKAAQETQERLLNIETSVFGFDAPTVPGNDENRKDFLNSHIAEELQNELNAGPLLLGLNRLMRAICLELFDTTDLEEVDAETQSLLSDSDTLGTRVTVKTRMDRVDEIVNDLTNRHHALTSYYLENISKDEGKHTYTPILNSEGNPVEKRFEDNETDTPNVDSTSVEKEKLLNGLGDDHSGSTDYDEGHAWAHLSSAEDISHKGDVPFGTVAAGTDKHTPNKEDCGIIRVPETEEVEKEETTVPTNTKDGTPENVAKNETRTRKYTRLKISYDAKTGTYKPIFVSKAVAWDTAKLERINQKLSEVTKTIYGADDVQASLPNRTEVLRRNVTNLIDDLYPNRTFAVEPLIGGQPADHDLRYPFKKSFNQGSTRAGRQDLSAEDYTILTSEANQYQADENNASVSVSHYSIVKWIDNALFNYDIPNEYMTATGESLLKEALVDNKSLGIKNASGKFITTADLAANEKIFHVNTCNLSTDVNVEGLGSYKDSISKTELLSNLIGLKYAFIQDLLEKDAWFSTGALNLIDSKVINNAVLKNAFKDELKYKKRTYTVEENTNEATNINISSAESSDDILNATNVDFLLSRKQKSIMERLTTIESYLDANAKADKALTESFITNGDGTSFGRFNDDVNDFANNVRFEEATPVADNRELSKKLNDIQLQRIFDLDISDEDVVSTVPEIQVHNRAAWAELAKLYDVVKTPYVIGIPANANLPESASTNVVGYYKVSGQLKKYIENGRYTDVGSEQKDYFVLYYTKGSITAVNVSTYPANTILIEAKQAPWDKDLASFVKDGLNEEFEVNITGKGYQNQTEQILYKTLSNILTDMFKEPVKNDDDNIPSPRKRPLLYYMSLREHPIGSVYMADNNTDPKYLFGGRWIQVTGNTILKSGSYTGTPTTIEDLSISFTNNFYTPSAGTMTVTGNSNEYKVSFSDNYGGGSITLPNDWGFHGGQTYRASSDSSVEYFYLQKNTDVQTITLQSKSFYTWVRVE